MSDEKRLRTLDEQIAASLRESEKSGEMAKARDYGKPLDFGDGYDDTPPELRMAFKILKDSGYAPPEVELMRSLGELRRSLATMDPQTDEAAALRQKINALEVDISMRIEKLGTRKL